ncbi:fructose-1,6-bisphosphatase [Candidatus Gracilibacteria bacterium]|nr:fructose-1,6-bisphosphatase [Candidatus Gracilibacteria bacterium]
MKLHDFLTKNCTDADLVTLMGKIIPEAVKKVRMVIEEDVQGMAGSMNSSGEQQLALDVRANQIVIDTLGESKLVGHMASEELENEVVYDQNNPPFTVVFDPLDGSSLVDVNMAVGSIFGVYAVGSALGKTGDDQLAACYAVYGPRTTFVLTLRNGVHEFRLEKDGEFYLRKENLKVAEESKYFAPGNLRAASERADYVALMTEWMKRKLTLRYSGGMVPDVNHIFLKGSGVFVYPGYSEAPQGKLRILFEAAPFALIMEEAGGAASDGSQRVLSKPITELHQRTPIYLGSKNEIERVVGALAVL